MVNVASNGGRLEAGGGGKLILALPLMSEEGNDEREIIEIVGSRRNISNKKC